MYSLVILLCVVFKYNLLITLLHWQATLLFLVLFNGPKERMANYNDDKLPRLTCDYRTISRVQTPNYVTHTIELLKLIENMPLREKRQLANMA